MNKRNRKGFSLVELVLTVAILGVIAAISFVAVVKYYRDLKLVEYDQTAKEIYLTAQHHLSLADTQQLLDKDIDGSYTFTADDGTYYIVHDMNDEIEDGSMLAYMMPDNSIDDTVREGGSYIIHYNKDTATILEVFYSYPKTNIGIPLSESMIKDLDAAKEDKSARKHFTSGAYNNKVFGWYDAEKEVPDAVDVPAATVKLINEERLYAEVTVPEGEYTTQFVVYGETSGAMYTWNLNTANESRVTKDGYTYTIILDDITSDKKMHFAQLNDRLTEGAAFIPGENITVYAISAGESGAYKKSNKERSNSLFASLDNAESGNDVFRVSNGRHFANMGSNVSSFDASKFLNSNYAEMQMTNDISWKEFQKAIEEKTGQSADQVKVYTSGSTVTSSAAGKFLPLLTTNSISINTQEKSSQYKFSAFGISAGSDAAGVFGTLQGSANVRIHNLILEDGIVEGGDSGVLIGTINNASGDIEIENVIAMQSMENEKDWSLEIAEKSTVTTTSGDAGGLIGSIEGNSGKVTVKNSASTAVVTAKSGAAGGLVGSIGSTSVSFENCYVSGHTLQGEYRDAQRNYVYNIDSSAGAAGGFVGTSSGSGISYKYCYTTASVRGGNGAGGFAGSMFGGTLDTVYASNEVTADAGKPEGGFVGTLSGVPGAKNAYYASGFGVAKAVSVNQTGIADLDITAVLSYDPTTVGSSIGEVNDIGTTAMPYDSSLNKFIFKDISELHGWDQDGSEANKLPWFIKDHVGDWGAPVLTEGRIINGNILEADYTVIPSAGKVNYATLYIEGQESRVKYYLTAKAVVNTDGSVTSKALYLSENYADLRESNRIDSDDNPLMTLVDAVVSEGASSEGKMTWKIWLDNPAAKNGSFHVMFPKLWPGENITVKASWSVSNVETTQDKEDNHDPAEWDAAVILYDEDELSIEDESKRDKWVNSLYESKDQGASTVKIENARHLMNLSNDVSNVNNGTTILTGENDSAAYVVQDDSTVMDLPLFTTVNAAGNGCKITDAVQIANINWNDYLSDVKTRMNEVKAGSASTIHIYPSLRDSSIPLTNADKYPAILNDVLTSYDGGNYSISNLNSESRYLVDESPENRTALFAAVANGQTLAVKNLKIENPVMSGMYSAAVLGENKGTAALENVDVVNPQLKASASGSMASAVVVSNTGTLSMDEVDVSGLVKAISADQYAAGFLALNEGSASIANSTLKGSAVEIKANTAGGIAAYSNTDAGISISDTTIETTSLTVTGTEYAGGFIGSATKVKNSTTSSTVSVEKTQIKTGDMTVSAAQAGGLAGNLNASSAGTLKGVEDDDTFYVLDVANLTVTGTEYAGGIVGHNHNNDHAKTTISDMNYSVETLFRVSGTKAAGGFVGYASADSGASTTLTIDGVKMTDPQKIQVESKEYAGGMVGYVQKTGAVVLNDDGVAGENAYATVTDSGIAGGMIGYVQSAESVSLNSSFASLYVGGASAESAGGMIGKMESTPVTISGSYYGGRTEAGRYKLEMPDFVSEDIMGYNVSAVNTAGGMIGSAEGSETVEIKDSFSTGSAYTSSASALGTSAMVGYNKGMTFTVSGSYVTGWTASESTANKGSLFGFTNTKPTVSGSSYLKVGDMIEFKKITSKFYPSEPYFMNSTLTKQDYYYISAIGKLDGNLVRNNVDISESGDLIDWKVDQSLDAYLAEQETATEETKSIGIIDTTRIDADSSTSTGTTVLYDHDEDRGTDSSYPFRNTSSNDYYGDWPAQKQRVKFMVPNFTYDDEGNRIQLEGEMGAFFKDVEYTEDNPYGEEEEWSVLAYKTAYAGEGFALPKTYNSMVYKDCEFAGWFTEKNPLDGLTEEQLNDIELVEKVLAAKRVGLSGTTIIDWYQLEEEQGISEGQEGAADYESKNFDRVLYAYFIYRPSYTVKVNLVNQSGVSVGDVVYKVIRGNSVKSTISVTNIIPGGFDINEYEGTNGFAPVEAGDTGITLQTNGYADNKTKWTLEVNLENVQKNHTYTLYLNGTKVKYYVKHIFNYSDLEAISGAEIKLGAADDVNEALKHSVGSDTLADELVLADMDQNDYVLIRKNSDEYVKENGSKTNVTIEDENQQPTAWVLDIEGFEAYWVKNVKLVREGEADADGVFSSGSSPVIRYRRKFYQESFNLNNGKIETVDKETGEKMSTNTLAHEYVAYGDKVTLPDDPTREGYTFNGWRVYVTDDDGNIIKTKELTLYKSDGSAVDDSITSTEYDKETDTNLTVYSDRLKAEYFYMPADNVKVVANWLEKKTYYYIEVRVQKVDTVPYAETDVGTDYDYYQTIEMISLDGNAPTYSELVSTLVSEGILYDSKSAYEIEYNRLYEKYYEYYYQRYVDYYGESRAAQYAAYYAASDTKSAMRSFSADSSYDNKLIKDSGADIHITFNETLTNNAEKLSTSGNEVELNQDGSSVITAYFDRDVMTYILHYDSNRPVINGVGDGIGGSSKLYYPAAVSDANLKTWDDYNNAFVEITTTDLDGNKYYAVPGVDEWQGTSWFGHTETRTEKISGFESLSSNSYKFYYYKTETNMWGWSTNYYYCYDPATGTTTSVSSFSVSGLSRNTYYLGTVSNSKVTYVASTTDSTIFSSSWADNGDGTYSLTAEVTKNVKFSNAKYGTDDYVTTLDSNGNAVTKFGHVGWSSYLVVMEGMWEAPLYLEGSDYYNFVFDDAYMWKYTQLDNKTTWSTAFKASFAEVDPGSGGKSRTVFDYYIGAMNNSNSGKIVVNHWKEMLDGADTTGKTTTVMNGITYELGNTEYMSGGTYMIDEKYYGFTSCGYEIGNSGYVTATTDAKFSMSGNVDLYYNRNTYTLEFKGATLASVTRKYGEPLLTADIKTIDSSLAEQINENVVVESDYVFDGWWNTQDFESDSAARITDANVMPGYNLQIFAKWVKPIYTLEVYKVTGYKYKEGSEGELDTDDITSEHIGDVLYEKYSIPDTDPYYTFGSDGSRVEGDRTIEEMMDQLIANDGGAQKFMGWYYDEKLEKPFSTSQVLTKPVTKLYARYKRDNGTTKVKVRYIMPDGSYMLFNKNSDGELISVQLTDGTNAPITTTDEDDENAYYYLIGEIGEKGVLNPESLRSYSPTDEYETVKFTYVDDAETIEVQYQEAQNWEYTVHHVLYADDGTETELLTETKMTDDMIISLYPKYSTDEGFENYGLDYDKTKEMNNYDGEDKFIGQIIQASRDDETHVYYFYYHEKTAEE